VRHCAREAGASFSHITENIGMAVDADNFHKGWMHSPGHRENILDPAADSIGIAVVEGTEELYAVEDFARSVKPLSIEEQEKQVGELLVARGLQLLKMKHDVRKSCEPDQESSRSSKPRYIADYETPDISLLPERLEKKSKPTAISRPPWPPALKKRRSSRNFALWCCSIRSISRHLRHNGSIRRAAALSKVLDQCSHSCGY
jgi:hypothetical protein